MIQFRNVTKFYQLKGEKRTIVSNLSLTLEKGHSLGLLGRNGAGKSTLLKLISGSLAPDRGEILRKGRISWPLGFAGGFHPALTGIQNTRFVARIYGVDTDELVAYVEEFAELGPFLKMPVSTYSSGMKARLAFGVSMGITFDYYLVDEITAVGDMEFKRKCQKVFENRLSGSDVIMVSHSPETIRKFCSVAAILEKGEVRYFDDVNEGIKIYERMMAGANGTK
ncbi:ABC transporter ATP-binding protein [Pseudohalocynthiibacter aestuariivivens]|nr:ABC transporter ATP-binding protein [Pseudohalocynthiibacter aestuariivivens]MBS9715325.1 ABC transporter ATP-binding protein [Pseudohalocynthiibacter aestuariivivens]